MRPIATAALILSVGLVAAACGGNDATPAPTEAATAAAAATEAPGATAGASATEPAGEPTEAPEPNGSAFAKSAIHTSDDDAEAVYGLTSGRYRMEWRTTGCQRVDFLVAQVDGDFTYEKPSQSSYATATINDLPEGNYRFEQRDPACTEWSVRIDWMTN